MVEVEIYLLGLAVLSTAAAATWVISVVKRDVSIVDCVWGPLFVLAALVYAWPLDALAPRGVLGLVLVTAWALRLTAHIAWRNHGQPEDYRYREIRRRNEPHFAFKSLYLVFALQAGLAWIVSAPLLATARSSAPLGLLDAFGAAMVVGGLALETAADWQLARFKSDSANRGRVLDRGVWRYSRHPNYFGECCVWWGFACLAFATGAWWALVSPLLMTWLLLRVSGVAMLERTIGDRRPAYADYARRTSAFVPWPPRKEAPRPADGLGKRARGALPRAWLALPLLSVGCDSRVPLPVAADVDLERFMGRWYVIASIPTFIERGAHNAVESYERAADGTIATTFTFRRGSFDGELVQYRPRGYVSERSPAIWGMQFVWPIKAEYRIAYVADDYSQTIIARSARDYVWIMARTPAVSGADYDALVAFVAELGYDTTKLERVPQRW